MLEMKLDSSSLASARYFPADVPPYVGEEGIVTRIITRYEATNAEWVREEEEIGLDDAILEVATSAGIREEDARTALMKSTSHTGEESPFEMSDGEPAYVEAHPLLEMRPADAQARQRAYELSKVLPSGEARVIGADLKVKALYKGGALYSAETGE